MSAKSRGFTLMEMIGVVAVIAILGAVATPMVFDAIEKSKVSAAIQQYRVLQSAATSFYSDTGIWPRQRNPVAAGWESQLTANTAESGGQIRGWNGPYMEADIQNPINKGAQAIIFNEWRPAGQCDIEGDGTADGDFLIYRLSGVDNKMARLLSDAIDNDGEQTSGSTAWFAAGRVKLNGSSLSSTDAIICIRKTS